ncbi:hypothetical protein [Kitasatospora sp. McL0602]|uniref:hypothetical protein n=1 Tax=Kitasatospora sp. McL0602 TaxID=3439530 RepID=UPI003F8B1D07
MPPVADRHASTATSTKAPRARRRRTELDPSPAFGRGGPFAAAALQRALDRRDNGGATGH